MQDYMEYWESVGPKETYKRLGKGDKPYRTKNSTVALNANINLKGYSGTINILGGGAQNAVYKVTIPDKNLSRCSQCLHAMTLPWFHCAECKFDVCESCGKGTSDLLDWKSLKEKLISPRLQYKLGRK